MRMFKIIFVVVILIVFGVIEANAIDQSICSSGADVVLYPNGLLKSCSLKDSFSSTEIKCKSQGQVRFYENGQLEECVLAEEATIGDQKCKEFGQIAFYTDGKFRSCLKKD